MGAAMTRRMTTCALYSVLVLACATDTFAQSVTSPVTPGDLRSYSTISSIGLEWTVVDDTNNDAAVTVDYRRRGTSEWTRALPLVRVNDGVANILAGSVLFLPPDTEFEVRAVLSDPDGGAETRMVTVRTRRERFCSAAGIVINPAAFTFTSIAIIDALKMFPRPIIELHISNIHRREEIYQHSLVSKFATAVIAGLGPKGYATAVYAMKDLIG